MLRLQRFRISFRVKPSGFRVEFLGRFVLMVL